MTKFKTIRKSLLIVLLSLVIICFGALAVVNASVVEAGNVNNTLLDDNFNTGVLDEAKWFSKADSNGWGFSKVTSTPSFVCEEPVGGSHLVSTVPVTSNKIRVQIDIKYLNFSDDAWAIGSNVGGGGMFAVVYDVIDTLGGTAQKAYSQRGQANSGAGVYFQYSARQDKLLFSALEPHVTQFVDANGSDIPSADAYNGTPIAMFDASVITDVPTGEGSQIISNKSLVFYFGEGKMEMYYKEIGATGDGTLIAKTKNADMKPVKPVGENVTDAMPYVAMFMESYDNKIISSIEVTDFKVSDANNPQTVFNNFTESNIKNYSVYQTKKTKYMYFGVDNKLVLNSKFSTTWPLLINERITVNEYEDLDSNYNLTGRVKINSINENGAFGIVTGIEKPSSGKKGGANTSYIYFSKVGSDYKVGIETYRAYNTPTTLLQPTVIALDAEGNISYNLLVNNKGRITLKINGTEIYQSQNDKEIFSNGIQYIGYALSGSNESFSAELMEVKLDNLYYERPENSNINATFDDDPLTTDIDESNAFNKDEWFLNSAPFLNVHSNTAYVKDGQLKFENCASGSMFATQKQYSDFEFQLDITDVRREVVSDNKGNKNYPISAWIGIYWGVPYASLDFGQGVGSAYPLIYIGPEVDQQTWDRKKDKNGVDEPLYVRCMGFGLDNTFALDEHYDFWDKVNADKVLQFKIKVVESDVTISIKYKDETEWVTVGNVKTKETIVGNVALTTMGCNTYVEPHSVGATCGYFTADNIMVTNLDNNANTITIPFNTSKVPLGTDFDYQDPWLNEPEADEGKGCNANLQSGNVAICALAACASLAFVKLARRGKE